MPARLPPEEAELVARLALVTVARGRVQLAHRRLARARPDPAAAAADLRRAEDEEALVTLDFSADAKAFLQGHHLEVAKAMLNVGVQMAGRLAEGDMDHHEGPRVLH